MRRIGFLVAVAALAGCLSATPGPMDDLSDGPPDPELVLVVESNRTVVEPGETVGFVVRVRNVGEEPAGYRSGCVEAWDLDLRDASGRSVQNRRPKASCEGFRPADLEPGESLAYPAGPDDADYAWNATVREGDEWEDAEPGTYTLEATFRFEAGEGGRSTVSDADDVTVREDGAGNGSDGGSVTVEAEADRVAISPGETVEVNLTAVNRRPDPVHYRGRCDHTWDVAILDEEGDEVQHRRPAPQCMGFSEERLEPGGRVPYPRRGDARPFTWNGTVWDEGEYRDAEPGRYTIRAEFPHKVGGEDGETREAVGTVTVHVTDGDA